MGVYMVTEGKRKQIIEMLGKGLTPTVVSTAVGVSESYISQLLSTEEVADQVASLRVEAINSYTDMDDKYNRLENTVLDKLEETIDFITAPKDLLRAAHMLNNAKRRGLDSLTAQANQAPPSQVINLIMPTHTITEFKTNSTNQVIEASHTANDTTTKQTLITIPSNKLDNLLEELE